MDEVPLGWMLGGLVVLLALSGFFSLAETSMMAINRYRLRHLVAKGHPGAQRVATLLERTDRLLGVLLLGNNFINAAAASIVTVLTVRWIGGSGLTLILSTVAVTLVILVFSEITPKVIGATYPEPIALRIGPILKLLLGLFSPIVWFVNLFVRFLLSIAGLRSRPEQEPTLNLEELRVLVLEGGNLLPAKHQSLLLNLLGLNDFVVNDVMTPRSEIEGVNLDDDIERISAQLGTSRHTLQLLFRGSSDNVVGVIHVRKVLNLVHQGELTQQTLERVMRPPYFVPSGTSLLIQLQNFQETHHKAGLVVDEYGELLGWITVEDILEEIVGEFSAQAHRSDRFTRERDGTVLVEGVCSLRELNRKLGTHFPLDGPKTLNGLIVETLEAIPEAGTSLKLGNVPVEIVQTHDRRVKVARLQWPEMSPQPVGGES